MQRLRLKIDWQAIEAHAKRVDRIGFKVSVLIGLFTCAISPVLRTDALAKILGVGSAIALVVFAALHLFSDRRSFDDRKKDDIE